MIPLREFGLAGPRNSAGVRHARTWRFSHVICIAVITFACFTSIAVAGDVGASKSELIHNLLPTVVNFTVRKEVTAPVRPAMAASSSANGRGEIKTFVGSGFVIDPSGLLVTNYHVVEDAFEISVTLSDGTVLPGKTLHASRIADLAVVQVKPDHALTPVQWGDSNKVRVGDPVFAIGNPLGFGMSVSAGIISGLNRNIGDSPYDAYMQTDAAINHGSSGGPLFNMEGQVIGVDTAMASPTEASAGLGLARPSDSARFIVERLLKYGWVSPGWIGIKVQEVTPEMAEAMGAPHPEGSVVAWVLPGSPAKKAGIAVGDVVLKFGDDTPGDERALLRDIVRTPIGETVQIVVLHDGVQRSLPVTVASWPRDAWDERDAPMTPERPKVRMPPDLGLTLSAVPTADRAALGLEEGLAGVLVAGVAPGSDAEHRGMVDGDVILRVRDQPMAAPQEILDAIHDAAAARHQFVMMLVLPKVRNLPGPKWIALRLPTAGD